MKILITLFFIISLPVHAIQFNFLASIFGSKKIKNFGTYRAYANQKFARSCNEYKNITTNGYVYQGETGSGVYRIKPDTNPAFDVYCEMDTDGGGWTLIATQATTSRTLNTTAGVNESTLYLKNQDSKMSDVNIRLMATLSNSLGEFLIIKSTNKYIFRYSSTAWTNFSATGWTNQVHDAKNSLGVWSNGVCNGHYNNRGFSTYNDSGGDVCYPIYAGAGFYYTTYHTTYGDYSSFDFTGVSTASPIMMMVR